MEADLITIGDEILIGQIVDTNSAWMAKKLNDEGINIRQITSVSDQPAHIVETLSDAGSKSGLVLVTGGLGPTKDDRTKTALCSFFNTELIENKEVLDNIIELITPRGFALNTLNRQQALVPATAEILTNKLGTAPGLLFNHQGTVFVFMPGVPFEMKYIMEHEVLPRIKKLYNTSTIIHRTVLTQGLPESMLAERIAEWENTLPDCISLAYLPSPENMKLRLSARGEDPEYLTELLDQRVNALAEIIPDYIFGYGEDTMAGNIGKILKKRGLTISVAESCTGGNIAHSFTLNPGSSEYFKGGMVVYSNELKTKMLAIEPAILSTKGAVSKEVVESMAQSVRKAMNTDFAIATSGIAGPAGGTADKPVGTVWIAVADSYTVTSKVFNFGNNRERNIIRATQTALNMLRLKLLKK